MRNVKRSTYLVVTFVANGQQSYVIGMGLAASLLQDPTRTDLVMELYGRAGGSIEFLAIYCI